MRTCMFDFKLERYPEDEFGFINDGVGSPELFHNNCGGSMRGGPAVSVQVPKDYYCHCGGFGPLAIGTIWDAAVKTAEKSPEPLKL